VRIDKLITLLEGYPKDAEIQIECPNGLLVDPKVLNIHEKDFDFSSKITGYVLGWRH
jgi:hypothetical protein